MSEIEAQTRVLQHALTIFSAAFLASTLEASRRDVDRWSSGKARMPMSLLERTAELIMAKYHGLPCTRAGDKVRQYS
jgi:hypothetical protein